VSDRIIWLNHGALFHYQKGCPGAAGVVLCRISERGSANTELPSWRVVDCHDLKSPDSRGNLKNGGILRMKPNVAVDSGNPQNTAEGRRERRRTTKNVLSLYDDALASLWRYFVDSLKSDATFGFIRRIPPFFRLPALSGDFKSWQSTRARTATGVCRSTPQRSGTGRLPAAPDSPFW